MPPLQYIQETFLQCGRSGDYQKRNRARVKEGILFDFFLITIRLILFPMLGDCPHMKHERDRSPSPPPKYPKYRVERGRDSVSVDVCLLWYSRISTYVQVFQYKALSDCREKDQCLWIIQTVKYNFFTANFLRYRKDIFILSYFFHFSKKYCLKKTCVRDKLKFKWSRLIRDYLKFFVRFCAALLPISMCDRQLTITSTHRNIQFKLKLNIVTFQELCWKMFRIFQRLQIVDFKTFGPIGDGLHWKRNWKRNRKDCLLFFFKRLFIFFNRLFVQTSLCKAKSSKVALEASVRHPKQFDLNWKSFFLI